MRTCIDHHESLADGGYACLSCTFAGRAKLEAENANLRKMLQHTLEELTRVHEEAPDACPGGDNCRTAYLLSSYRGVSRAPRTAL